MNHYGPAMITQKAGIWYIDGAIYADGCAWGAGKITGALPKGEIKKKMALVKRAKKYCADYMTALMARKIPAPGAGDCFGCLMKAEDGSTPMGGPDHIKNHMEQKYFVPSLVVRACERFPVSIMARNFFAYAWNPEHKSEDVPDFVNDIARGQIGKALFRYVKKELGLAS